MRYLTKIICFILSVFVVCFCGACESKPDYSSYLLELKQDIFSGETENLSVYATYGFNENEFDGEYFLHFKLKKCPFIESKYTLTFNYNDTEYENDFSLSDISGVPFIKIPIKNFNEKGFEIKIKYGSTIESISLNSILPANTISHEKALDILFEKQSHLLNSYYDESGVFTAKIIERVIVKNGKPYYYIGIKNGDKLKALLIDGLSGKLLAVREVF